MGFLTIKDYDPKINNIWGLTVNDSKAFSMTEDKLKSKYLEYAVFYLSDFGLYQGDFLTEKATWQMQQGIESPKFLKRLEGTYTVILKVEKVKEKWETSNRNAKNDGLYRVLYNDGDDTDRHAFFETEKEALECFEYIIDLPFNRSELDEVLGFFGFWTW